MGGRVNQVSGVWRRLMQRVRQARRRPQPVELDLVQQLTVLTLARFGPQPYARIAAEISAIRPATPAEIVNGVLKLETAGVIERLAEKGVSQSNRRYALTRRGRRFVPFIPTEPRSVLEFHI
jgi:DNA-binding MarR family transcriptional regulator